MTWMTPRSTITINAAGGASTTIYPVNSFTLDPERAESIPGSKFAGKPYASSDRPGARWAECSIGVDLCAATAATTHPWKALFNACGFGYASGPVFTLGDPHFTSGDVYVGDTTAADLEVNVDGDGTTASSSWQTAVKTWVGGLEINITEDAIPQIMFTGQGLLDSSVVTTPYLQGTVADVWSATSVTTLPTATRWYPGGVSPTNSLFTAANLKSLRFATNTIIAQRRAIVSGIQGVLAPTITEHAPVFEALVEVPTVHTTTNPKPAFLLGTLGTIAVSHQFSTGNTFVLSGTSLQIAALPSVEDVDGVLCQRVIAKPTKASGITLTWTYT